MSDFFLAKKVVKIREGMNEDDGIRLQLSLLFNAVCLGYIFIRLVPVKLCSIVIDLFGLLNASATQIAHKRRYNIMMEAG